MQPQVGQLLHRQLDPGASQTPDDLDLNSGLSSRLQLAKHTRIANFGIVDQQLSLRAPDDLRELFSSIHRTDDEPGRPSHVRLPLGVRFEQFYRFLHQLAVPGDNSETTAVIDIETGEVERQYVQLTAVDDHVFAVITNQIIGGARHGYAGGKQSHLQLPQVLFAATIGVGDQSMDEYAAAHRLRQRLFDFLAVQAKNGNLHPALGFVDCLDERRNAVSWFH